MRKLMILLAILGATFGTAATAQEDAGETPEPCTIENAERASIETLAEHFREWAGRCVRVRGLHVMERGTGNRLYADRMAVLEKGDSPARSLALDYSSTVSHGGHRPAWEEIIGRFDSCMLSYEWIAQYRAENPNRIIMLTGLCHYTFAHNITPDVYLSVDGEQATRLRREEVPVELRELDAVEVAVGEERPALTILEAYLAAMADEDFAAFVQLSNPSLAEDLEGKQVLELEDYTLEDLGDETSAFGELNRAWQQFAETRDPRIFELVDEYSEGDADNGFFCLLRQGHSLADMPVRYADVDNDPSRPYFCVDVGGWVRHGETVPSAQAGLSRIGFIEAAD